MTTLTNTDPPPLVPCASCDRWADGLLDGRPVCFKCVKRQAYGTYAPVTTSGHTWEALTLPGLEAA